MSPRPCVFYPRCHVAPFFPFMLKSLSLYVSWLDRPTMFPDQYSSMPYFSRLPAVSYTDPPRLFHRQPPSPPGSSPGTSSGQLSDSPPPMKSDYDEASEYALLHPEGQPHGYSHAIHGVSGMGGGGMGYTSTPLNLSLPSVRVIYLLPTAAHNMFLNTGHPLGPPAIHGIHAARLPDWRIPGHGTAWGSIGRAIRSRRRVHAVRAWRQRFGVFQRCGFHTLRLPDGEIPSRAPEDFGANAFAPGCYRRRQGQNHYSYHTFHLGQSG